MNYELNILKSNQATLLSMQRSTTKQVGLLLDMLRVQGKQIKLLNSKVETLEDEVYGEDASFLDGIDKGGL
jgi:hypothetical protein